MTVRSQRHLREFYGSDSSGEGQITLVPDLSLDFSDMTAGSDLSRAGVTYTGPSLRTMYGSAGLLTYAPNNTLTAKSDMSSSVPGNCTGGTPAATPGYGNAKLITPHAGTDAFPIQFLSNPHITGNFILSFVAKSNGITHLYSDNFGGLETFDLTTGAVTQSGGAPSTVGSINLGDGWYRFYVNHTNQTDWYFMYLYVGAYGTYTANGTDGIYIGGAQIEKVTYETTPRTFNPLTADNTPYFGPRFDHYPAATVLNATELLPAAALTSSSGWVSMPNAAGTTFGSGGISFVSTGGYDGITYDLTNTVFRGRRYKVELTLNLVSGKIDFYLGVSGDGTPSNPSGSAETPGVQTISSIAYKNGSGLQLHIRGGPAGVATITNISIKAYDAVPKGLLIEEARTNALPYSSTFTNPSWGYQQSVLTDNVTTSPDGTTNAGKAVDDTNNDRHIFYDNKSLPNVGGPNTFSIYVKDIDRRYVQFNIGGPSGGVGAFYDLTNGVLGDVYISTAGYTSPQASITPVGNGWYKCSLTGTTASDTAAYTVVALSDRSTNTGPMQAGNPQYVGSGKGIYMWGAQLEGGAFPTSHIPTKGATGSRAVDNPTMAGTDFSDWYNPVEGTFVAVYDTFNPNTSMVSALNGGGSLNEWSPISSAPSSGNIVDYKLYTGGVQQVGISVSGLSVNTLQRVATAYKTNDFALVLNGAPPATDAGGNVGSPDHLAFGSDGFGSYILDGHIKSFAYYRTRLSDDTLRSLTYVGPTLDLDLTRPLPSTVTLTRGSSGTYTNSSGFVALALTDVPRIDYDPVTLRPKGLLIEEARTNLIPHSEDLASWNDFSTNVVTPNAAIAPDGNLTADRLQVSGYEGRSQAFLISASTTYTFSIYVKAAGTLPNMYLTLHSYGGAGALVEGSRVITTGGVHVGNGWYRHVSSITTGVGDTNMDLGVRGDGAAGGSDYYAWGMQFELGAFATSYIPTTSAPVSRAADLASMTGSNFSGWYNQSYGTFVWEGSRFGTAQGTIFQTSDGSPALADNDGGQLSMSLAAVTYLARTTNMTANLATKIAAAFRAGDHALSVNGAAAVTNSNATAFTTATGLYIGRTVTSTAFLNGWYKSLKFYPLRLGDAYLQELTSLPAATYYVDTAGSDSADGLSPGTAWQTIAKVNASHFQPGATIRFQGGQTFSGNIVCPSDRMTFNSYGTGQATISAGAGIGFRAVSKSSITVQNLIFVGNGITTNGGNGISIENNQSGNTKLFGPTISGCTVSQFGWTGIHVSGTNGTSGFNGVLISNCVAHDCTGNRLGSESGISVDSDPGYGILANGVSHLNVRITGCTAYNNTGTAGHSNWTGSGINLFETDGGVIEYCVAYNNGALGTNFSGPVGIWLADTKNCVIQFCESHHNKTNGVVDGGGFDIDGGCQNCIIQYCYSHDNYGSGYQLYAYEDSVLLQDSGNILRYCISENDGTHGLQGGIMVGTDSSREMIGIKIYNNTVYQSGSTSPAFWVYPGGNKVNATITNNIFQSAGTSYLIYNSGGNVSGIVLDSNVYYAAGSFKIKWANVDYTTYASWRTASSQEAGNNGLTTDPLLTAPGAGAVSGRDLTSLSAYKIRSGSPAVNSGAVVSGAPAQDFYGDIVPLGGAYDRGAHELA